MKNIHYIGLIITGLITFLSISCTQNFGEINTDPTAGTTADPSFLLRQILWNNAEEMSYESYVAGHLLSQHFTAVDFNLFDRHSLSEPQFGGNPWPSLYQLFRDNEIILNQATHNPKYAVYEGPARIMKAYIIAQLTDLYGDVPYLQAGQGSSNNIVQASYDKQSDIYLGEEGIINQLILAKKNIQNYNALETLEGDILYGGDLSKWHMMANSLLIKYYMRCSAVENVSEQIQGIYNEGLYIQANIDNASFNFSANQPNNFRMAELRTGDFNLFIMSETAQNIYEQYNDPRVSVFYKETESMPGKYQGLLNGQDASNLSISISDYSLGGSIFREETQGLDGTYVSAWETAFFLAEAAQKGILLADAKSLYEQAVHLSFEYWGVTMPDNYLTEGPAAYDDQFSLEQIITQKWISNTINGYEAWVEYRRTGFPALKTLASSLNNDLIPVRMPYPKDEAILNQINYETAAENTDQNSINYPVWWDID